MANLLNGLFGGQPAADPVKTDSDFADFAEGAEPAPVSYAPPTTPFGGPGPAQTLKPFTKWYNVHERYSLSDFRAEGIIISCIAVILVLHWFGARLNRNKAKKWIRANAPLLAGEFALVGFSRAPTSSDVSTSDPDSLLKEKSLFEFATYATGRANVAFVDVKLTLTKRFNPITSVIETALSFFADSFAQPQDALEAVLYPFDGKEALIVPGLPGAAELNAKGAKSTFDGFVWALVHKESMKQVRDERYDLSLTFTKDNVKLPNWLTVMTESAEITDLILTPELIKAAEAAGDLLEYFIVTDQSIDKPTTLEETEPRKRVFLKYRLPADDNYEPLLPIFQCFLRVTDLLTQSAKFRPEVLRKVKAVREEAVKQLKKADEDEKAEERAAEREKVRKAKRDAELKALDAKAQKKYLDKEREKELRKSMKKQTTRG